MFMLMIVTPGKTKILKYMLTNFPFHTIVSKLRYMGHKNILDKAEIKPASRISIELKGNIALKVLSER